MLNGLKRHVGGMQLYAHGWSKKAGGVRSDRATLRQRFLPDLVIALCVFLVGMGVGASYISTARDRYDFYQIKFGPAVMLACNRGFVDPVGRSAALGAFLLDKSGSLSVSCDDIPPDIKTNVPHGMPQWNRYLYFAVAFVWSIMGVSWPGLTPLFAALYGATSAVTFGLFRLGTNRVLAVLGTLVWIFSAMHLYWLPDLRDYSKAPFLLASILVVGYLVSRPVKRSALLGLSTLCGIIVGIGIGFRMDVLIVVPAFVIAALLLFPGKLTNTIVVRLLSIAVFLLAFFVSGWPILSSLESGSNTFHVLMFGFERIRNETLGVTTPSYEWIWTGSDAHIITLTSSYAYCMYGRTTTLIRSTEIYDQLTAEYFIRTVLNFPADMLTRIYGSVLSVLGMPFSVFENVYQPAPRLLGFFVCAALLLMLSRRSVRLAIFVGLVMLYFVGYSSLNFHPRHMFYLAVVPLLLTGFIVQQVISRLALLANRSRQSSLHKSMLQLEWWRSSATRRMFGFAVGSALLLLIPLYALRWYQQGHIADLRAQYVNAELEPLAVSSTPAAANKTLLTPREFPTFVAQAEAPEEPALRAEYLVIEVDVQEGPVPLTFHYWPPKPSIWKHTKTVVIPGSKRSSGSDSSEVNRLYVPVFTGPKVRLEGIEGPEKAMSSVKMFRIKDSCQFPMFLTWTLSPGWQSAPLYQTISQKAAW